MFGVTGLWRLSNQTLLIAHLRGGPGAGKLYKAAFTICVAAPAYQKPTDKSKIFDSCQQKAIAILLFPGHEDK